jgi:peptide-methionine (R)-S-oxide reductase
MHDDESWRSKLDAETYRVTRQKGTERPFSGKWLNEDRNGDYTCVCCGAKLFEAGTKFDAGCGWPSFYAQSEDNNVVYREDLSHGMVRVEIVCKQCDSHLGHVFPDGPEPTGQRYCVNSVSLNFSPK